MMFSKESAREAGRKGGEQKQKNREAARLAASEVSQQTMAIQARWAAERGSEEEVTEYFKRDLSIEDGLALLARMRENCKVASETLNARITADSDKDRCEFCGGPKRVNKQWAMVRPYRDPVTLLPRNRFFCSIECVALMNRRNQGVYGVSDQGMLPAHNPQFHPKDTSPEDAPPEPDITKNGDR
jgi:hypothetical protein